MAIGDIKFLKGKPRRFLSSGTTTTVYWEKGRPVVIHEYVSGTTNIALAGSVDSVSTLQGTISAKRTLLGSINGLSSIQGTLRNRAGLFGTINSLSSLQGTLEQNIKLFGSTNSSSSIQGVLRNKVGLFGSTDSLSALTGVLNRRISLIGLISPISNISGTLSIRGKQFLSGSINSISTLTGVISCYTSFSIYVLSDFNTGDTVTINIYRLSDDIQVVTTGNMSEIGTTGSFKYFFNQIITTRQEYLYIASNGTTDQRGKIVLGSEIDIIDGVWTDTDEPTGPDTRAAQLKRIDINTQTE